MKHHEILFQPDGLRIAVEHGTPVSDAMKASGIKIQLPCAGTGKCGKCTVEIHPDPPEPNSFDCKHLPEEELERGVRLACQTRIDRNMSVLVSPGIRILDGKILVDGIERTFYMNPVVSKKYIELPEPTLEDQAADLFRVKRAMNFPDETCPDFEIELLRELPGVIRSAGYKVTIVTSGDSIMDVEPGDTTGRLYGMAFDIGTTTVVGTIMDLSTGSELSYASRLNAQVVYGEDTISRIKHVIEHRRGSRDRAEKIRGVVNEIIREASEKAGISAGWIIF